MPKTPQVPRNTNNWRARLGGSLLHPLAQCVFRTAPRWKTSVSRVGRYHGRALIPRSPVQSMRRMQVGSVGATTSGRLVQSGQARRRICRQFCRINLILAIKGMARKRTLPAISLTARVGIDEGHSLLRSM